MDKPATMAGVEPRPTVVPPPIHLRIADDIRMQIERGDLAPGESLPTLAKLCELHRCSTNSARGAIALLRAQGLIVAGRGRAPIVRVPPRRVIRSSERHQVEKDLVLMPVEDRAGIGEAETNLNMPIAEQVFDARYDTVSADADLANVLAVDVGEPIVRRVFEGHAEVGGRLLSRSVSYIPRHLIQANPALLDARHEPWPGGTQHQLSTVGIEVMRVIDLVTARMPTTVESQLWELADGVPLLFCRRISVDGDERPVEISDAYYPADRTEFRFITTLTPWAQSPGEAS